MKKGGDKASRYALTGTGELIVSWPTGHADHALLLTRTTPTTTDTAAANEPRTANDTANDTATEPGRCRTVLARIEHVMFVGELWFSIRTCRTSECLPAHPEASSL